MWKNFKRSFTSNWGLKLLAFVLASVLWLVVVNIDDPSVTKTFTASVQVVNDYVLTDQGKYYNVKDNNYAVSFKVTARRSIIEKLSNSDFTAIADMNYLDGDKIPIEITANVYTNSITFSTKTYYLTVEIGDMQNNSFIISAQPKGDPADGCTVKSSTVSPNVVTVSGPDTVVSTIDHVYAPIDVTGYSTDVRDTVIPVFYDKDGKEIDTSQLTLNISTVKVNVDIAALKEISIEAETTGTPADGYEISDISITPATVMVVGEASNVSSFNKITIPAALIDVTDIAEAKEYTVDINQYLPSGVSLQDSTKNQVTVKVNLQYANSKTLEVPTANLVVKGLDSTLSSQFAETAVNVIVKGTEAELALINAKTVTGYVDLTGLTEGTHSVEVKLNLSGTLTQNEASTKVILAKKGSSLSNTNSTESDSSKTDSSTSTSESSGTTESKTSTSVSSTTENKSSASESSTTENSTTTKTAE